MKNSKKLITGFIATCLFTLTTTTSFAASENFSTDDRYVNKIQMSQGSSNRHIKAVPATNILLEAPTGRLDISRGSSNRHVVAVPATNIPDEPEDCWVSWDYRMYS